MINAPAGSGKTWVLTAAGQAWAAAGLGRVIGITPSQSARNTLAVGVPESYNTAQFLGHLPGQRGARGPVQLRPGDLVLMDEASMVANPDLADSGVPYGLTCVRLHVSDRERPLVAGAEAAPLTFSQRLSRDHLVRK